jgi:hypothetical protein
MNSDHRRHRDFDQDNDRHEAHHSKIGKDAVMLNASIFIISIIFIIMTIIFTFFIT